MEWWRWVEGTAAAVLVLALLALRFDTLKDRPGSSGPTAVRRLAPYALFIPVVFLIAVIAPWWVGLIAIAIPGMILLAAAVFD